MQKYSAIIATDGGRMLPVGLWRQWPDDYRHGRREDRGVGRGILHALQSPGPMRA
ncbi:MAG: hypothetical protein HFH97_17610 [Lachnospiraceae bacterium]|nr:hypothetical protein [Lachnospiraceae bacterium]